MVRQYHFTPLKRLVNPVRSLPQNNIYPVKSRRRNRLEKKLVKLSSVELLYGVNPVRSLLQNNIYPVKSRRRNRLEKKAGETKLG